MVAVALFASACTPFASGTAPLSASQPGTLTGKLGGADYRIEVPAAWNGTLFLYSHGERIVAIEDQERRDGSVGQGGPDPADTAPNPDVSQWLLAHRYAIAGSSYSSTGWAVEDALEDQVALLDLFRRRVARPQRVIAWGQSMGGMIAAGLAQLHPDRFAAAIPMCAALAGAVADHNTRLDGAYAFKTLLAPRSNLQLVGVTDPAVNTRTATRLLIEASSTPAGRARLALVAALTDLPGWYEVTKPEPAPGDADARAAAQILWLRSSEVGNAFGARAQVERRAGGNPSWNVGVDYARQLSISVDRDEVAALYQAAGLDLGADLRSLDGGPRTRPDSRAVAYLDRNVSFDGRPRIPVLSAHTTADGAVIAQHEIAYADAVKATGHEDMLRQVYVHRAGHCAFTSAETIAVAQALLGRLDRGRWDDEGLRSGVLDQRAQALGARYGTSGSDFVAAPAFADFDPGTYPRPFAEGSAPPA